MSESAASAPDLARIGQRLEALERAFAVGDADRVLVFGETCETIRRSPATVRRWWARRETRATFKLDVLFARDVTGRLVSSPRRIASWQAACRAKWAQR